MLKQRPNSARIHGGAQFGSTFSRHSGSSNQHRQTEPPPHEDVVSATMKTHFYSTLYATAEEQPKKTFLPRSRFPTVPPIEPVPASKYRRPPIAPKWFLEQNAKPTVFDKADFRMDIDEAEKSELVDEFMSRNKHRMALYDYSYKNKKFPEIREDMMSADRFLNQMTTYAHRERSYVCGTSSARMKSLMDQSHQESIGEAKDPFLTSLRSSRADHNQKLNNILGTHKHVPSEHTRGFRHAPEYGNFSNLNGILKSNENSVLQR